MKKWTKSGGFTILETMIVMSVSAAMLLTVILMFSGKQREVQFSQSIRSIESKILDLVNDTATGYFPQDNTSTCTAGAGDGGGPLVVSSGSNEQGTNQGCIFLGRALHFKQDRVTIYPIAGDRTRAESAGSTASFAEARPTVADVLEEEYFYPYGLELKSIHWDVSATDRQTDGALIIFASSPNGTGQATGGGFNPGIQKVSAYTSGNPAATAIGFGATVSSVNASIQSPSLSWPSGGYVILCFEDSASGAGRRFAGVVVSGGTRELASSIQLSGMGYQCT
jgi:type II secretory pathway pseudopilin PulG